jgi:uncharacterized protein (TIGR02246 family)
MTTERATAGDETQIREMLEARVRAVRAGDIAGVLSAYAPDVVSFDVVDPLRHAGRDAIGTRLEAWLSTFQLPIGLEIRDLSITAGGDVAFCHGLSHVSATKADGGTLDMWWRSTICCRRVDGRWAVTHEHSSVPFDMESGKASLDLKP